jgi:hypothetical protein
MRKILSALLLICSFSVNAQYDVYIKSLLKEPEIVPNKIPGEFVMKRVFDKDSYEFSNLGFQIVYYPPDVDCGHFSIEGKQYLQKGRYKESQEFGCDLDAQSMETFEVTVGSRNYLLITSIALTSGKGTRVVFCQLFDVTDKKKVIYFPLWSLYGSHLSFGDYNNDGRLDFLETRYEVGAKDDNTFRVVLKTLDDRQCFQTVKAKYIVFHQEYTDDQPKISVIEKSW